MFSAVFLFAAMPVSAQTLEFNRWTFDAGGGLTPTIGPIHRDLGTGWNIVAGGGYNLTKNFGAELQLMYDGLGVSPSVISEFAVPGANAHLWGYTLDPFVRFRTSQRLGFYFIGGGGYYRRILNFTEPTTQLEEVFDPFFGFQVIPISSNQTIGTITRVGWGGNIGAGITYKLGDSGARFFTEVRYHYVDTYPAETEVLPITAGIRW